MSRSWPAPVNGFLTTVLCFGALLAAVACGGDLGDLVSAHEKGLYVYDAKIWDSPNIPVCWKTAGSATQKGWVRDAVNRAWARQTHVNFTGWGTCGADPQGISIQVSDAGPYSHYGTNAQSNDPSMLLNFTFNNFRSGQCQGGNEEKCIRKIAVHEFGHALAFIHEHQRNDRDPNDPIFAQNAGDDQWDIWNEEDNPATPYGPYDADSIMTFTYTWFDLTDNVLSPGDIIGVRSVYGRKPQYSLVGVGGKCLDVKTGVVAAGKKLQMYPCHGKANQQFTVSNYSVKPKGKNLYVATSSSATQTQATVVTGGYNLFVMKKFQLTGMGGMCLSETNGSYVRLKKCDGSASQLWQRYGSARVKSVGSGKCLRLVSNKWLSSGACSGAPNLYFSDGAMRIGSNSNSTCLDVKGGYKALSKSYAPFIQTYPCKGANTANLNQRWVKRGELTLKYNSGKCLDVQGNTTVPGARAQIYPCHGGNNQKFDYYF